MDRSENKAYKIFLQYFADPHFFAAWLFKYGQCLEIGTAQLFNGEYRHHVWVKLEGKFCSLYGMPSNVTLIGDGSDEEITVQWFTENPKWTWENEIEPPYTFHRKDEHWTRKI